MKHAFLTQRIWMAILGVLLIGFSISCFTQAKFGTDPCSVLSMGVSGRLGIPFGITLFSINMLMLIVIFFILKERRLVGLGTLINLTIVGFSADFFNIMWNTVLPPDADGPGLSIALMLVGIILLSIGFSLYSTADIGVSPYDSLAFIIEEKTKIQFRWCRIATDLICVIIGFLLGAIVGVATVITALFMGPLVSYFNVTISQKLLPR